MKKKTIYKLFHSPIFDGDYIKTEVGYYAYISLKPININLMKEDETNDYIQTFSKLILTLGDFSFICTDIEQNYLSNIKYLKERYENTKVEKIKEMIKNDISFIQGDNVKRPSKRLFLISIFSRTKEILESKLFQTKKVLDEYSLENHILSESEIKKMLNKYYFKTQLKERIEEYEGEKAIEYWKSRF